MERIQLLLTVNHRIELIYICEAAVSKPPWSRLAEPDIAQNWAEL
jgi:hypothetical protein